MRDTFLHHGHTVLEILDEAAQTQKTMDLQDLFYRFTLDSIGQIGFGVDLEVLKKGNTPFADAFDKSQALTLHRHMNPIWFLTTWLSPEEWRERGRKKVLTDFTQDIISARR